MGKLIDYAQCAFIFTTWLILAIAQVLILPLHLLAMLITRGCDSAVQYMSEIQAIAVEKLKAK